MGTMEETSVQLFIEEEEGEDGTVESLLKAHGDRWREEDGEYCQKLGRKAKCVGIAKDSKSHFPKSKSVQLGGKNSFSSIKKAADSPSLLRGPRRVMRLCTFAVLLPLTLVLVPLYVRLIVYPPQHYAMAPSDQRMVDQSTSSIWCQSQSVHMNGSFNAYLVPHTPHTSAQRNRHTILKRLKLRDDVKEYWGFYFRKGSTVTLSTCTRYDGGQLMILRGSENLHRCAWIGEEDSLEEVESQANLPSEDDLSNLRVTAGDDHSIELEEERRDRRVGSTIVNKNKDTLKVEITKNFEQERKDDEQAYHNPASEERKHNLNNLLRKALRLSKGKYEIMNILKTHQNSNLEPEDQITESGAEESSPVEGDELSEVQEVFKKAFPNRVLRSLSEEEEGGLDNGGEEIEDTLGSSDVLMTKRYSNAQIGVEQIIGGLTIPDGLTYERGFINQTHSGDLSQEEHRSSYSSSEEALASCEGVILALPLHPDSQCTSFDRQGSNKISYEITVDGTYYFVFSSDNEIVVNDLFFNMTLDKVVYDTTESLANCTSSQNCSLDLRFWSEDKTVVEVPADNHWDDSYVLDTVCEPRVPLYLCLMLMVPILILFCAFQ